MREIKTDWLRLHNFPHTLEKKEEKKESGSPDSNKPEKEDDLSFDILPTFFIGLGGTGYEVINRIKGKIEYASSKGLLPPRTVIEDKIQYLYYDPDTEVAQDMDQFLDIKRGTDWINPFPEGSRSRKDDLVDMWNKKSIPEVARLNDPKQFKLYKPELPSDIEKSFSQILMAQPGLAAIRLLGKLAFLVSSKSELRNVVEGFVQRQKGGPIWFVLVGSMCGGTGSSTFLDLSAFIRRLKKEIINDYEWITVVNLIGPDLVSHAYAQDENDSDIFYANAYAVLREINWLYASKEKYQVQYSENKDFHYDISFHQRRNAPFQYLFIIDRETQGGHKFKNMKDLAEMTSDVLCQLFVGGGFERWWRKILNYVVGRHLYIQEKDEVVSFLSSFGGASIEIPIDYFMRHNYYQLALDWIDDYAANITENNKGRKSPEEILEFLFKGIPGKEEPFIEVMGIGHPNRDRDNFNVDQKWLEVIIGNQNLNGFIKSFSDKFDFVREQEGEGFPTSESYQKNLRRNLHDYWSDDIENVVVDSWRDGIMASECFRKDTEGKSGFYRHLEQFMKKDLDTLHDSLIILKNKIQENIEVVDTQLEELEKESESLRDNFQTDYRDYIDIFRNNEKRFKRKPLRIAGMDFYLGGKKYQRKMDDAAAKINAMNHDLEEGMESRLYKYCTLKLELIFYNTILLDEINEFIKKEIESLESLLQMVREKIDEKLKQTKKVLSNGEAPLRSSFQELMGREDLSTCQSARIFMPKELYRAGESGSDIDEVLDDFYERTIPLDNTNIEGVIQKIKSPIRIKKNGKELSVEINDWAQEIPDEMEAGKIFEDWAKKLPKDVMISKLNIIYYHIISPCTNLLYKNRLQPFESDWCAPFYQLDLDDTREIASILYERSSPAIQFFHRANETPRSSYIMIPGEVYGADFWERTLATTQVPITGIYDFQFSCLPHIVSRISLFAGFSPTSIANIKEWRKAYDKLWASGKPLHIFPVDKVAEMPHLIELDKEEMIREDKNPSTPDSSNS